MADLDTAPQGAEVASQEVSTEGVNDTREPGERVRSGYSQPKRVEPEAEDGIETAAEEPASEPEAKPAPKKRKVKFADREVEFDEDVASLIEERETVYNKRKEHLKAANDKFEEAAKLRKEKVEPVEQLAERVRQNPMALFELAERLGVDPNVAAKAYAENYLKQQEMSPEQRALQKQEQDFQRRQQDLEQREQKIQAEQHQREVAEFQQQFAREIPAHLEKYGLPDDALTVGEIGRIVAGQLRAGMQPDYEAAAEMEAERLDNIVAKHLERLGRTPGALAKKYPELAKRLREEGVASATTPRTSVPGKPMAAPRPTVKPQNQNSPTWQDEERELRARRYGLPNP